MMNKKELFYDEQGVEQISNQIMSAYTSGTVDRPDINDEEENSK
ncbi:hypothetical protein [Heyndrickxia oleronia]|nr:hypothetical protein [Heyndrickxia oleronia]